MALIKCSECGSDISEKATECLKCGCPMSVIKDNISKAKKAKRKKIMVILSLIVAVIIIICIIAKLINQPNKSGYYQDTKWGMTTEQLKQKLGDDVIVNDEKKTILLVKDDYDGKVGIDAMISYDCDGDSLKKITVMLSNGDDSSYTDSKLIDEYAKELDSLYGESLNDGIITYWETLKSRIELTYLMDGVIILSYEDITEIDETE